MQTIRPSLMPSSMATSSATRIGLLSGRIGPISATRIVDVACAIAPASTVALGAMMPDI